MQIGEGNAVLASRQGQAGGAVAEVPASGVDVLEPGRECACSLLCVPRCKGK